jgi:hypothetical protein
MHYAFITSTGRTGTDFFTYLFSDVVKNSWSQHEPKPAFRRRSYAFLSRKPNWYDEVYFGLSRRWFNLNKHKDWYVETNYHLFDATPLIRNVFPDALTIHIIRDGRQVVRSWLNRYRYITNDHITAHHLPGDPAQAVWDEWNPVQKLSWYWKTVNQRAARLEPDLFLRFEDIFKSENSAVFDILAAMPGVEFEESDVKQALKHRVNSTRRDFFPKFEEWPEEWKQQFWEIAGEEMVKQGYVDAIPYTTAGSHVQLP